MKTLTEVTALRKNEKIVHVEELSTHGIIDTSEGRRLEVCNIGFPYHWLFPLSDSKYISDGKKYNTQYYINEWHIPTYRDMEEVKKQVYNYNIKTSSGEILKFIK